VRAQDRLGNVATDARSWKRGSKAPVIGFGGLKGSGID
jgi:hypothetical protein